MIDLTQYQEAIKQFYTPEVSANLYTYSLGLLAAETGEVIGLEGKRMRGDTVYQDNNVYRAAIMLELGDITFALASIATDTGEKFIVNPYQFPIRRPGVVDVITTLQQDMFAIACGKYIDGSSLIGMLWAYAIEDIRWSVSPQVVTMKNIEKLQVRAANNLIMGSGHGEDRR